MKPAHTILVTALLLTGCGGGPKDVTKDPAFGNFAAVQGHWKTKVPLRLAEHEKTRTLYLYFDDGVSPAYHRYVADLPAGTEIVIEKLVYRETIETTYLDVIGFFAEGPYVERPVKLDRGLFASDVVDRARSRSRYPEGKDSTWAVAADKLERVK